MKGLCNLPGPTETLDGGLSVTRMGIDGTFDKMKDQLPILF